MEVSTEPPWELEESSHDDLDIGRDAGEALSTENEAGALVIFDSRWQDGSEDAVQFRHDEGGPDSLASAVEDKNARKRRQASTSTSSSIVLKFRACSWSENSWDPTLVCILMSSVETTDKRYKVEVPSTSVIAV